MRAFEALSRLAAAAVFVFSLAASATASGSAQTVPAVAVAAQYDSTHVYVAPEDIDAFVRAFLGTFGGQSTKPVLTTVTPTPSTTISRLLQTPVGMVSLFAFKTGTLVAFAEAQNNRSINRTGSNFT